ncbi:hypothetical protein [Streptomyces sp. NPDC048057]
MDLGEGVVAGGAEVELHPLVRVPVDAFAAFVTGVKAGTFGTV